MKEKEDGGDEYKMTEELQVIYFHISDDEVKVFFSDCEAFERFIVIQHISRVFLKKDV